jgi:predicted transcriptional regulator
LVRNFFASKTKTKVRFTTYIREDLHKEMAELAEDLNVPQSALYEQAIKDFVRKAGAKVGY